MPNSHSEEQTLICDRCGGAFPANVWLTVDIAERPDLAARLVDDTLHQYACPHCGQEQHADLPVLVYRSSEAHPLIYGMVDRMDEQTQADLARHLAVRLAAGLGSTWREEWVAGGVPRLPRGALPALVFLACQVHTAKQAPSENQQAIRQAAVKHQIYQALDPFFKLESLSDAYHHILANPLLLREETDALLSELITDARGRGLAAEELLPLEQRRDLLRRSRAVGTGRALAEEIVASGEAAISGETEGFPAIIRALLSGPPSGQADGTSSEEEAQDLGSLAVALLRKYDSTAEASALDAAVHCFREAANRAPLDSPDRPLHLLSLATALRQRFASSGQQADADAALACVEEVLATTPAASPRWPVYLQQLALLAHLRSQKSGQVDDLEHAISLFREALACATSGSAIRPTLLIALGRALQNRYVKTGVLADLTEALALHREAVASTSPHVPERRDYVEGLGRVLLDRYRHSGARSELEEAIACFYLAHQQTPADSPRAWAILEMLCSAYLDHYQLTRQRRELDIAIAGLSEVVRHSRPEDEAAPERMARLAQAVRQRYELTAERKELDLTIALYRQAFALTPPASPSRPFFLANVGLALRDRCGDSQDAVEYGEAVEVFEQACRLGLQQAVGATLTTAQNWGRWAGRRGAWSEAVRAYDYGLQALDRLYTAQLLEADRARWLNSAPLLIANAAYSLARSGDARKAVMVLERGYARALRRALSRFDLDLARLREADPEAHERLQQVTQSLQSLIHLERLSTVLGNQPDSDVDWVRHLAPARVARDELIAVMQRARQVLGDAEDDEESTWAQIAALVEPGSALVYLLTSQHGGLALTLHRSRPGEPAVVTPQWVDEFTTLSLVTSLVSGTEEGGRAGYLRALVFRDHAQLTEALGTVLPDAGRRLVFDLVAHLRQVGVKRLTLIPGGSLRILPLHALPCEAGGASALLDLFTVRYAPSAGILASCQRRLAARPPAPPSLLAVGNPLPLPPDIPALLFAELEVGALAPYFGGRSVQLWRGDATPEAVTAKMAEASHIHLACHSRFDPLTPFAFRLQLSGSPLDLAVVQRQVLDHTRLIVLSACETAVSDVNIPDEVAGLAAALLERGALAVVGSLWEVDDLSTGLLMQEFYRLHLEDNLGVAEALCAAQRWLRNATAEELALAERWEQLYRAPNQPHSLRAHAFHQMRYHRRYSHARPFCHPYYWAAFVAAGAV